MNVAEEGRFIMLTNPTENFKQPDPSERRLPSDEVIRVPYKLPKWWDKPVIWNSKDNKNNSKCGRPK